jgi:glycerophosphoryl diester phosphodiesterase
MQIKRKQRLHRGALWRRLAAGIAGAVLMTASSMAADPRPFVIAHRGASGYVPEHTLAGYFIAIQQGADYVEPDLVISSDGALLARHENEISGTTDVASHPEFAARKATRNIDGEEVTGWFTEDSRWRNWRCARARLPGLRSTRYDGVFEIPTFDRVLTWWQQQTATP